MDEIPEEELLKSVRQFLVEFKALVDENGLDVTDRLVNKDALLELGLTARQREDIVLSLTPQDYSTGPLKDAYKSGYYWIFGKLFDHIEIYIKLKIAGPPGSEQAVCFSFHKAERPLSYPYP
jgi:hypothetical protein